MSKLSKGGVERFILFLNKRIQDKSKMHILYVLLISAITGYSQPKTNTFLVDRELIHFVVSFEQELSKRGAEVDWSYQDIVRSEERRVGKECRYRWSPDQ